MNGRPLLFLLGICLLAFSVLLFSQLVSFWSAPPPETFLKYNHVRGIAVQHRQLLYTLNFNQQNHLINLLNRSIPVKTIDDKKQEKPSFEKIVIYRFHASDLEIDALAFVEDNLIFSAPEWKPKGYLMDISQGELKRFISETYDP